MNSWIIAVRPQTLIASIAPVITSTSLCIFFGFFNFYIFVTTFFTAVLLQILANFINDLSLDESFSEIGPNRVGSFKDLIGKKWIKQLASNYKSAFENSKQTFPYFTEQQ